MTHLQSTEIDMKLKVRSSKFEGLMKWRENFMNDRNHIIERVYFSELTFYNGSGMIRLLSESFELQMGEWVTIV